jgi:gas vesicle protein
MPKRKNSWLVEVFFFKRSRGEKRMPHQKEVVVQHKSGFGDFFTGIVIGGTIGYLAALLFAPRAGEETREMLAERGRVVRDRAKDTMQTAVDKTGKIVSESRERIGNTVETAVNRSRDKVDSFAHDIREQASDTMVRAAEQIDPNTPGKPVV